MNSKTPKFDEALKKYFSELELDEQGPPGSKSIRAGGQERACRFSGKNFYITVEDIKFYKKMGVPLPTLSPHERMRRKLGFLNITNLFFVKSSLTGRKIVSCYPPTTPYKIYEHTEWNDTDFSTLGKKYDSKKSFFEQYKDFQLSIPRPGLDSKNTINSDFCNSATGAKNCFLCSDVRDGEDSAYSEYLESSKNIYHSFGAVGTDICFDSSMIFSSYEIFFSEFSNNCVNSSFLFDCRDCTDCFMCTNLRHKKYHFYNQKLSREEYQEKIVRINLGSRKEIQRLKKEFKEFKKDAIHRANHNEKNVNCTGDYINNSKNCCSCFYVMSAENCAYCLGGVKHRDCYDVLGGHNTELSYETLSYLGNDAYNIKFSGKVDGSRDSEYCDLCRSCTNCFACIGLNNKKFCIFNKQYTEDDYWQTVDEIKTSMLENGEYGELFPPELSPVPYNISTAVAYGGYDDPEIAKKYGYKIEDIPDNIQTAPNEISFKEVPDDIKDINENILQKAIVDKNEKRFRYTKEELAFHRKHNLALPIEHYSTMLARKRISIGPIDFNSKYRNCAKCGNKTQVTFPGDHPNAPIKVYCEQCYNKEIV